MTISLPPRLGKSMSELKKDKQADAISRFATLAELPEPQNDEIVEPKSFRNSLIRVLLWMALIPAFALFFLLHHQIQSATRESDTIQLAIAGDIARNTSNFFLDIVKSLHFSTELLDLDGTKSPDLSKSLDGILHQQPNLVYGAWLDEKLNVLAESNTRNGWHPSPTEFPIDFTGLSHGKLSLSQVARNQRYVAFATLVRTTTSAHLVFIGLLQLDPLVAQMRSVNQGQRFTVALLDQNQQFIFNSADTVSRQTFALTPNDWDTIKSAARGCIIRSGGTRNIAEVRSFVHIPELQWTVVLSEPILQRDALLRSSTETALLVLVVTLAASILAGYFLSVPLTRSINDLTEAVFRFGRNGRFDPHLVSHLEKDGTTEIVALGKNFEGMAKRILDNTKKLARLNAGLEKKVSERTATIVLRNRELRALHRLLVPIHPSDNRTAREFFSLSLKEFQTLLELSELSFIPIEPSEDASRAPMTSTSRVPVAMNTQLYGWLEVGENDILTSDRAESLARLANSMSIVLANKKLIQELEKEHATLTTVFESITDGIVILGRSGAAIYSNDLASKMLFNSGSLLGRNVEKLLFSRWEPAGTSQPQNMKELAEPTRFIPCGVRQEAKHPTLEVVPFRVSDLPGFSGERTGLLVRDITREAEIESIKDNLLSVVAHELKTPVTAMGLMAQSLCRARAENTMPNLEEIEELVEESERLGRLIDDLLDISRIQAGAMKLSPTVVQVASLIDRAARLTQSRYSITIKRTIDPEAETLFADPDRLTQVFVNLFNNAARYKKDSQQQAECRVTVLPQDEFVRIEITDFGRGIPEEIIGNIFDRFYQANMTDQRMSGGTGLGLTIVRGIVEAHGGSIRVESVLERYSKFVILLPL